MNEYVYPHIDPSDDTQVRGMTLRDYFAAKAMRAFINRAPDGAGFGSSFKDRNLNYSNAAYAMADAMLQAREQN